MASRFTLALKAKFSRFLDRVEDPGEILDYGYSQQVEQLYGLRRDIADLATARKRTEHQRQRREEKFMALDAGARRALALNREDLARQALERKHQIGQEMIGLDQVIADLKRQEAQLVDNVRKHAARVERFRAGKEVVKATYAAAQAQVAISEAASGVSSQLRDMGDKLERAREKTEALELQASVNEELERTGVLTPLGSTEDDIDRQLRALTAGVTVDAELERMKRQRALGA